LVNHLIMLRFCSFRCHNSFSFQTLVRSRLSLGLKFPTAAATATVASRVLPLSSLANPKGGNSNNSSNSSGIKIEDDDSKNSNTKNSKSNDVVMHMLYRRDASRNALPKASFLVSSLNSAYWLWYVFDFIPAVNASPIEELHADPIYGFGGLGLSLLIQSAFTLYPLSLVSKIGCRVSRGTSPLTSTATSNLCGVNTRTTSGRGRERGRGRGQNQGKKNQNGTTPQTTTQEQRDIVVWKHTLPFLHTSSKPLIIPVGGITMDKTSDDTRKILEELGGDVGKFEGHLGLTRISEKERKTKPSNSNSNINSNININSGGLTINFPLLVEIRSPSEVCNSEMMLQTLLSGKFKDHARGESKSREGSVGRHGHLHGDEVHRQRTKHKQNQRHHRKNNRGAKR